MSNKFVKCYSCGDFYDNITSRGNLQCRFHPLNVNTDGDGKRFKRFYRECCGAFDSKVDFTHYERHDPIGCVNIDHCSSFEDLYKILETPYFAVSKEDLNSGKCVLSGNSEVIHINKESQLVPSYEIVIPFRKNKVFVDLNEIYLDKIIQKKTPKAREIDRIGDYYMTTRHLYNYDNKSLDDMEDGEDEPESDEFIPFCIVRRVSSKQCSDKLKELGFYN